MNKFTSFASVALTLLLLAGLSATSALAQVTITYADPNGTGMRLPRLHVRSRILALLPMRLALAERTRSAYGFDRKGVRLHLTRV